MAKSTIVYDVFISHAPVDSDLARNIAEACRESGLVGVTNAELLPGADVGDAVWDALAESRALITILSSQSLTPSMSIEIGAAKAWNKPIYVILRDPSARLVGLKLSEIRLYTEGKVPDVIRAIKTSVQQFSDEDRLLLRQVYAETGVSVDQLLLSSRMLEKLVTKFARVSGKQINGERLLSELLRMRKQKTLARRRPAGRSAS